MGAFFVYKTTNTINGKVYVGQTTRLIDDYFGSGILISNAIEKYGRDKFIREILCVCSSQGELDTMEKYWISRLNSQDRSIGYNLDNGGCGTGKCSQSHKEKMKSKVPWNRGKTGVYSNDSIEKMKKNHHRYWLGRNISNETKAKISRSRNGTKAIFNPYTKVVKFVGFEEVDQYLLAQWRLGRK